MSGIFHKFKSVVASRTTSGTANGSLSVVSSTTTTSTLMTNIKEFAKQLHPDGPEKDWMCPCGHRFRATGEWIACHPAMCEAPRCPNPQYYISGPGRALLEAHPGGVPLQQISAGSSSSSNSSSSSSTSSAQSGKPMSRFR